MKGAYEFGKFRLNTLERSLESAGRPVSVTPKALDVLMVLVENRGRIVEKSDLIRQVWPDTFVEDNSLAFNVSVLRKLFGESGAFPRYIETVPKRGYRFIAEVLEPAIEKAEPLPSAPLPPETEVLLRPRAGNRLWRPALVVLLVATALAAAWRLTVPGPLPRSLAVLPFRALDIASADDSLEVGLTDALIARLTRSLPIPVRSTSAVLRYRNRPENPLASGAELGVDAVLEGTFQKHDGSIRSSVRLVRTRDGKVLYAGVFNQRIADLFRLEDTLSMELAGALILKLTPYGCVGQAR